MFILKCYLQKQLCHLTRERGSKHQKKKSHEGIYLCVNEPHSD